MKISARFFFTTIIFITLTACQFLSFSQKYKVTVTQVTGGVITVSPVKTQYTDGDQITVTATASENFAFSRWSGDITSTTNPVVVTVNGDTAITAVFVPINAAATWGIAVPSQTGGSISLSPAMTSYADGEIVTATATPATGFVFSSWSGDVSGTTSPITFSVAKDTTVSATFAPIAYSISATQTTGGAIALSPSKTSYAFGDSVTVTASPTSGYIFQSWKGDVSGTANPLSFSVAEDMSISASFAQVTSGNYTISITPPAGGSIQLSPNKTNYDAGESITATAVPSSGFSFGSWSSGLSGTTSTQTFTVTGNMTLGATFTANSYTITVAQLEMVS